MVGSSTNGYFGYGLRPRALVGSGLLLAGLLAAAPAEAFRCGSRLVSSGDPASRVLAVCGEPTARQQRVIYRTGPTRPRLRTPARPPGAEEDELLASGRSVVEVSVEEWTYNLGPRRLMRLVLIENGYVVEIRTLGYGYRE